MAGGWDCERQLRDVNSYPIMNFMWLVHCLKLTDWPPNYWGKKNHSFWELQGQKRLKQGPDSFLPLGWPFTFLCTTYLIQTEFGPCLYDVCSSGTMLFTSWAFYRSCSRAHQAPFLFSFCGRHDLGLLKRIWWLTGHNLINTPPPIPTLLPQHHLDHHSPSGFLPPLNGTHCLPTVFHFLFLLVPLLPLSGPRDLSSCPVPVTGFSRPAVWEHLGLNLICSLSLPKCTLHPPHPFQTYKCGHER